ncbi:YybH family protein [Haloferax sp. YSMS24]|uniref:YybH family protein n=1 Tax=unclassified Haloferax TaxID=2625095 RepID=UPI00398D4349
MALEDTIKKRTDEVGDILTSKDGERIANLYTEKCQLMPPASEIITGRDEVAAFWFDTTESGVDAIDIEPIELEEHDALAIRTGRATLHDASGTTLDDVKFIEVWKQEDGEWRIHRDIWNSNLSDEQ